jgi:photosystem II stability/assembly factor-like uncharacterized protein
MRAYLLSIAAVLCILAVPVRGQVSWDSAYVGTTETLSDVALPTASTGYAAGGTGPIVKTTNGGQTWTKQSSGTTLGFTTIAFTDTLHGCAAGGNILRYTTNGGSSWLTPAALPAHGTKSIAFGRWNVGAAVGTGGQIIQTTNGGVNWTMVVSSVGASLFGVAFADSANAFAAGNNRIARSTDGGLTWSLAWTPSAVLWDVTTFSAQLVVAVGYKSSPTRGIAYRSTDLGITWDSLVVSPGAELKAVSFCSRDTGFVLSSTGGIYKTRNGGSTWDSVSALPSGAGATGIAVSSPWNGIISAAGGYVWHSTSGTVSVSEPPVVPVRATLEQNYPNPFNPSTTIRYSVPSRSHVLLTVFNALGQQVAQLVNGEMESGYHQVTFDGRGLSSGMYFYRIIAGSLVQTRQFVMIR